MLSDSWATTDLDYFQYSNGYESNSRAEYHVPERESDREGEAAVGKYPFVEPAHCAD